MKGGYPIKMPTIFFISFLDRNVVYVVYIQYMFLNKNTHEQVAIFNDIIRNIFSNYIPNKYVTIDDGDPPWMIEKNKK